MLLVDAATNAVTGVVYAFVGWKLRRKDGLTGPAERAWARFGAWWFALAATGFIASLFSLLAYVGVQDVALFATIQDALIITFAVAMACLVYYVIYLWTGQEWTRWPVHLMYVVYVALFFYEISASRPRGIIVNGWRPVLEYEVPFYPGFLALSFLFLFLPQSLAALTYLFLYFRTQDAVSRRRIMLVATGILGVSAGAVVIARPILDGAAWIQIAGRLAVIAAAFAILAAYLPERAIPAENEALARAAAHAGAPSEDASRVWT